MAAKLKIFEISLTTSEGAGALIEFSTNKEWRITIRDEFGHSERVVYRETCHQPVFINSIIIVSDHNGHSVFNARVTHVSDTGITLRHILYQGCQMRTAEAEPPTFAEDCPTYIWRDTILLEPQVKAAPVRFDQQTWFASLSEEEKKAHWIHGDPRFDYTRSGGWEFFPSDR